MACPRSQTNCMAIGVKVRGRRFGKAANALQGPAVSKREDCGTKGRLVANCALLLNILVLLEICLIASILRNCFGNAKCTLYCSLSVNDFNFNRQS
jgi:hypothetical protein